MIDWILVPSSSISSRSWVSCFVPLSFSFIFKPRVSWTLPDLTFSNFPTSFGDRVPCSPLPGSTWHSIVLWTHLSCSLVGSYLCSLFLAVTGLDVLSLCWNCFPSIPPFGSSFFVLWLTNDGETGPWWELEQPVAEGGSAQITAKNFKLCACGSIDSDFIFSFWWGILNELWVATITTGSPLLSPQTHSLEISAQSIPPSFNEKRKVTNFIYKSGYWKIPLVGSRSASNSQHFMRVILSERDFSAHGSDSHEIWGPAGMSA